ncbi:N-formylglutamate deformylase [Sphingomonas sp. LB-2]|uniref:N-formylglutamate deformylase n=1 Tax=Sphingomonas caeni TaxID=2984949 RepID=UPI002231B885|nr:N-formylglutamate deformylase [Sphingomonas caeni]MCW3848235.1 N-formylglutamate deformylase [Sphingomonas caeni]
MIAIERGQAPLIVSIPHAGTEIPDDIAPDLISLERARHDADLYIDKLYAFAGGMGATIFRTTISRTVIDMNRDPSGASLYPGMATTGLCPLTTFGGDPLWREGREPDEAEIARRRALYFEPYHKALHAEINRLCAIHPRVVVYEAHSIRSHVPMLFDGELPQFNIGTNSGAACAPELAEAVAGQCSASQVVDGRFKGGWTTRHYGQPEKGVHAIQMELAMRTYLDEAAPAWDEARAEPCKTILRHVLAAALEFAEGRQ